MEKFPKKNLLEAFSSQFLPIFVFVLKNKDGRGVGLNLKDIPLYELFNTTFCNFYQLSGVCEVLYSLPSRGEFFQIVDYWGKISKLESQGKEGRREKGKRKGTGWGKEGKRKGKEWGREQMGGGKWGREQMGNGSNGEFERL